MCGIFLFVNALKGGPLPENLVDDANKIAQRS